MEFAHFETLTEFYYVSNMVRNHENIFIGSSSSAQLLVDGMTSILKSKTDWFWTVSGKKIPFEVPFLAGEPNNHQLLNEYCLSVINSGDSFLPYRFNDRQCNVGEHAFLCQKKLII